MDVSIELDHPNTIFTNGDTIYGRVVIYCLNTTVVVTKISVRLTGETESVLVDTTGLLMDRREGEKHCFVHESQVLLPTWDTRHNTRVESLKLGFGYHRFDFALKLPWFPECPTCPPNSPIFQDGIRDFGPSKLPSSMSNLVGGADVSYRINTAVTTYRNLFQSTTRRSTPINVWPNDTLPDTLLPVLPHSMPSIKSVQANVLGALTPSSSRSQAAEKPYPVVAPSSHALITAHFLQDFHLSHSSARNIALRLTAEALQDDPCSLYLSSFQLLLFAYTDIRAGSASSGKMDCWTIQSLSNLGLKLHCRGRGDECEIDAGLWRDKCVPDTAVPTFEACNVARRYELEILLGLQSGETSNGKMGRVSVVQIRVPVRVGSGLTAGRKLDCLEKNNRGTLVSSELEDEEEFPAPPTYEQAIRNSKHY